MTIHEVIDKRELAVNLNISIRNMLGKDIAGSFNIEDFETKTFIEFREFVLEEMKRLNKRICVFSSWIFTKQLYNKFLKYIEFEHTQVDPELYFLVFPDILTFVVFDSKELLTESIKKTSKELKETSNLNIKDIEEFDNGIRIEYYTKYKVLLFEEKPKELGDIFKEDE